MIPHDFITHKRAWRDAILLAMATSDDPDERSYWLHELNAYDNAHKELEKLNG